MKFSMMIGGVIRECTPDDPRQPASVVAAMWPHLMELRRYLMDGQHFQLVPDVIGPGLRMIHGIKVGQQFVFCTAAGIPHLWRDVDGKANETPKGWTFTKESTTHEFPREAGLDPSGIPSDCSDVDRNGDRNVSG